MAIIPAANIMILEDGEEITKDSRFFAHEAYGMNRERAQYPQGFISDEDARIMPFASLANRPPLAISSIDPICPRCLLDFSRDVPPSYSSEVQDIKDSLPELAGMSDPFSTGIDSNRD
jgi:hypothetical protein